MTPTQCRMARAALGWSLKDLARHADLSISTINTFEKEDPERQIHKTSVVAVRIAIEGSGEIQFVTDQGVFYLKKNPNVK